MDTNVDNLIQCSSDSIKRIDSLIQCVSDSIKKKDEEIANLKLEIKNLESILEISEKRAKKSEEENKKLQYENSNLKDEIITSENSNNAYIQVVIEALGEIPSSIDAFKESIDKRIQAAYNDGYGAAMGKMIAFLNKIKSEPTVDTEAKQKLYQYDLQKVLDKNPGRYYFCIHNNDLLGKRLPIVLALSKTCEASQTSVARYLDKFVKNIEQTGYTTILSNVSEDICRTLENHLKEKGIGYSWYFV